MNEYPGENMNIVNIIKFYMEIQTNTTHNMDLYPDR